MSLTPENLMHTVFARYCVLAFWIVMSAVGFASPATAQTLAPTELEGDWGTPEQCAAQDAAGPDTTVSHVRDAPYRINGHWLSRWFFYCRVMEVFPGEEGFRVWVLCGEDAIERPWEIDITQDGSSMSMRWWALGEDAFVSAPWDVGPLQRCTPAES